MHAIPPKTRWLLAAPAWTREPVVHFIALGAVIFIVFAAFGGSGGGGQTSVSHSIRVTKDEIAKINSNLRQDIGHQPSSGELSAAIDNWVRDEVMHREGLANGLDQNDPVIRQRVVQLMKWYMTGLGTSGEPTEQELRGRYEMEQEKNRGANIVCFEQIYFSTARRGKTAETDARTTWSSFQAGTQTGTEVAIGHGDSMGGDVSAEEMQRGRYEDLKSKFGLPFLDSVQHAAFDRWTGPFESNLGWHVVRHLHPKNQTFEELRAQLRSEMMVERGSGNPEAVYAEMKRNYSVQIDDLPPEVAK